VAALETVERLLKMILESVRAAVNNLVEAVIKCRKEIDIEGEYLRKCPDLLASYVASKGKQLLKTGVSK